MDFSRTSEQNDIYQMAFSFGQEEIAPNARDWESEGSIPKTLWPKMAELGFGGLYVNESAGGAGLKRLDATLVFEALSAACPTVAAFLSIHNMCAKMIETYARAELRDAILPGVIMMKPFLSYCLTEPGSGSDASALQCRAQKQEQGYVLNGSKAFISGGGYSDGYIVMARSGDAGPRGISAFYVPADTPGLSFGALEDKMGWRAQPTRQVHLEDCFVSQSNRLGDEGEGFKYAMAGLDGGRLNIAACSLGAAAQALKNTLSYMQERHAFGQKIANFQALQFRLADMETDLSAARILLYQAAWKLDQKAADASKFCAMAKKFVTETASSVADQCLQLHGGYGYLCDYGIEKVVRDLRVHQILEGTNEIMRLIVARHMLAEYLDG